MIDIGGDTVAVEAEHIRYVIEPIRFKLGFTRVQMVDDYLARLRVDNMTTHTASVDALLDARNRWAA